VGKSKSMMRALKSIPKVIPQIVIVPCFGAVLLMIAIIFIGVIMRYAVDKPLSFVDEYSGYLLALIIMFGLAYGLKTRAHVSVDLLIKMLPRRVAAYLETFHLIVALGFVILLMYGATLLTVDSFVAGKLAWSDTETPLWMVQWVMPVGLAFFTIVLIAAIVTQIRSLRAPKEEAEPPIDTGEAFDE
jgi:TRAP-type C4-dicarboxylate transport system permease small subunit